MANSTIAINEPLAGDTDKKIDAEQLTVGAETVQRERVQIAGTGESDISPVDGTAGLKVDLGTDNDVSLNAGTNVVGKVRLVTALGDEVTEDIDNSMNVTIVADDVGIGGGTQYTEDAAAPADPQGNALMVTRDDALSTVTEVEGDWSRLRGTAEGALWTQDANSDAILADTANMDTNLGTVAGAVSGTEMQVDVVAALPAGTNAIGKLAANSGVDIGDVDVTSITGVTMSNAAMQTTGDEANDAVDAGNPLKIGGRAQSSEAQPEEVADNDRVDALFDRNGYLRVRGDFDPSYADINDSTSGDNTIVAAAGAGKRIAVWAILIVSDGTVDVRWEDGAAGTAFTGQVPLQAREGYSISAGGIVPLFVGSANTLLNLELSAAVNVHGFVSYTVIDD